MTVECYKRVENYKKVFISVRKSRFMNKNIQYTMIKTKGSKFSKTESASRKEKVNRKTEGKNAPFHAHLNSKFSNSVNMIINCFLKNQITFCILLSNSLIRVLKKDQGKVRSKKP